MVDDGGGHHKTRVDGPSNDPSQRVPRSVIKPVVETVKSFLSQELCSTEIKVPIYTYIGSEAVTTG